MATDDVGVIYGTVGVVIFMSGALLGGFVVARHGLKFWLWPMLLAIHLPDAVFIWLAYMQPENLFAIGAGVAVEQFGYGFGFMAFMLYMIYIARGEHQHGALRHLHRFHGAGHHVAGHVERLVAGASRLSAFFRLGDSGDDSQLHRRAVHPAGRGIRKTDKLLLVLVIAIENKNIVDEDEDANEDDPELNCLNAPDSPESKLTMKSIPFNRLCRALVLPRDVAGIFRERAIAGHFKHRAAAIPRRASIILIVADGLGYGDLSCYGQTNFQTPNLDKLAAEGVRFTNYRAGAAADSPACAALMLGKDSGHLRQRADADIPLAPDDITVAQVLKRSGYHTGLIGEWNLGDENSSGAPWKKGFDEFAGYFDPNDAENFYADYMFRYAPHTRSRRHNNSMDRILSAGKWCMQHRRKTRATYIPDLLTKAALNFIKINQPDPSNHYRPFFLLLNYKIPGDGKSQVPTDAPFSEEQWPQPEKNKAAMIARLDGYIGQLQEQLQKLGMTNNTAVFFTSDTIPKKASGVDPEFFHSNVSTNDFRVPMIVRWPDRIPAGRVSDFKWSAKDFLPTAADIAFTKPPADIDGKSVLPALTGERK